MKFVYEYRTSDNVRHSGEIVAADRDSAFAALKARGIRPSSVVEAPGFFNKLFGKGKRWIAIVVLAVIAVLALRFAFTVAPADWEDRSQLYGDPVVIAQCEDAGWTNVFSSAFDCHLAAFAIPGREVPSVCSDAFATSVDLRPIPVLASDLAEIAQMKRMVNGMKLELAAYLDAGGTPAAYAKRLVIRQLAERRLLDDARLKLKREKDSSVWKAKNAELRAMGLPMVAVEPDSEAIK